MSPGRLRQQDFYHIGHELCHVVKVFLYLDPSGEAIRCVKQWIHRQIVSKKSDDASGT